MNILEIKVETYVAIFAAMTSLISALSAYRSSRIARKNFSLAERTLAAAEPSVSVYLIDAFRYRLKVRQKVIYVFCVSATNKATTPNSIIGVEMRLKFSRDGFEKVAVFSHTNAGIDSLFPDLKNQMHIPAPLAPRAALVANCCFEVPDELIALAEFESHAIQIRYAGGLPSEIEPKLIMDLLDVDHLEKKRKSGVPV